MDAHMTLLRGLTQQEKLGSPSSSDFALFPPPPQFVYCAQGNVGSWRRRNIGNLIADASILLQNIEDTSGNLALIMKIL